VTLTVVPAPAASSIVVVAPPHPVVPDLVALVEADLVADLLPDLGTDLGPLVRVPLPRPAEVRERRVPGLEVLSV
jgi:hypothetical protein